MTADSAAPSGQEDGQEDGPEELTAEELLRRLRAPGELTAAEVAALYRLDGGWPAPDDDPGYGDPGPWPTDLPDDEGELAGLDQDETAAPEALDAGFTHRHGGTGTGAGFAAGG